jgi:hypothetical protein
MAREMVMQMSGSGGVLSMPAEHLPGLIALVLIGPVVWMARRPALRSLSARRVGWADRAQQRLDRLPFGAKVVRFATLVRALVRAVIVPRDWSDERVTAFFFHGRRRRIRPVVLVDVHRPAPLAPGVGRRAATHETSEQPSLRHGRSATGRCGRVAVGWNTAPSRRNSLTTSLGRVSVVPWRSRRADTTRGEDGGVSGRG